MKCACPRSAADRTLTAHLASGSEIIAEAITYYRPGPENLFATFDLTQVAPGTYDVVITHRAGQVERIVNAFDVVHTTVVSVARAAITAPNAFRRKRPDTPKTSLFRTAG